MADLISPLTLLHNAQTHISQRNFSIAIGELTHALTLSKTLVAALWLRADCYRQLDDFDHAKADLDKGERIARFDPQLYTLRGMLALDERELQIAYEFAAHALELDAQHAPALRLRTACHIEAGHFSSALADAVSVFVQLPDDIDTLLLRAQAYNQAGRRDLALQDLNRLIERDPDNMLAYDWRGRIYLYMGKQTRAYEDFERVLTLPPYNAQTYLKHGQAHAAAKHYNKALADFNETLRRQPNHPEAYLWRAIVCVQMDNLMLAYSDLEIAQRLNPTDPTIAQYRTLVKSRLRIK
jgi:tetratricopeptide (TPR) repeat protein